MTATDKLFFPPCTYIRVSTITLLKERDATRVGLLRFFTAHFVNDETSKRYLHNFKQLVK